MRKTNRATLAAVLQKKGRDVEQFPGQNKPAVGTTDKRGPNKINILILGDSNTKHLETTTEQDNDI